MAHITPPLINDSVLPSITPAMFYNWVRWRLKTSAFLEETFIAIFLARGRGQDRSYKKGEHYQEIIERVSHYHEYWTWHQLKSLSNEKNRNFGCSNVAACATCGIPSQKL